MAIESEAIRNLLEKEGIGTKKIEDKSYDSWAISRALGKEVSDPRITPIVEEEEKKTFLQKSGDFLKDTASIAGPAIGEGAINVGKGITGFVGGTAEAVDDYILDPARNFGNELRPIFGKEKLTPKETQEVKEEGFLGLVSSGTDLMIEGKYGFNTALEGWRQEKEEAIEDRKFYSETGARLLGDVVTGTTTFLGEVGLGGGKVGVPLWLTAGGLSMEEAKEKGMEDSGARFLYGNTDAMLEFALEKMAWGKGKVGSTGIKGAFRSWVGEYFEEAGSSVIHDFYDPFIFEGQEHKTFKDMMLDANYQGTVGFLTGPLISGSLTGINNLSPEVRQRKNVVKQIQKETGINFDESVAMKTNRIIQQKDLNKEQLSLDERNRILNIATMETINDINNVAIKNNITTEQEVRQGMEKNNLIYKEVVPKDVEAIRTQQVVQEDIQNRQKEVETKTKEMNQETLDEANKYNRVGLSDNQVKVVYGLLNNDLLKTKQLLNYIDQVQKNRERNEQTPIEQPFQYAQTIIRNTEGNIQSIMQSEGAREYVDYGKKEDVKQYAMQEQEIENRRMQEIRDMEDIEITRGKNIPTQNILQSEIQTEKAIQEDKVQDFIEQESNKVKEQLPDEDTISEEQKTVYINGILEQFAFDLEGVSINTDNGTVKMFNNTFFNKLLEKYSNDIGMQKEIINETYNALSKIDTEYTKVLNNYIKLVEYLNDIGITPNSEMSKIANMYSEGKYPFNKLVKKYGIDKAQQIEEAVNTVKSTHTAMYDIINSNVMSLIPDDLDLQSKLSIIGYNDDYTYRLTKNEPDGNLYKVWNQETKVDRSDMTGTRSNRVNKEAKIFDLAKGLIRKGQQDSYLATVEPALVSLRQRLSFLDDLATDIQRSETTKEIIQELKTLDPIEVESIIDEQNKALLNSIDKKDTDVTKEGLEKVLNFKTDVPFNSDAFQMTKEERYKASEGEVEEIKEAIINSAKLRLPSELVDKTVEYGLDDLNKIGLIQGVDNTDIIRVLERTFEDSKLKPYIDKYIRDNTVRKAVENEVRDRSSWRNLIKEKAYKYKKGKTKDTVEDLKSINEIGKAITKSLSAQIEYDNKRKYLEDEIETLTKQINSAETRGTTAPAQLKEDKMRRVKLNKELMDLRDITETTSKQAGLIEDKYLLKGREDLINEADSFIQIYNKILQGFNRGEIKMTQKQMYDIMFDQVPAHNSMFTGDQSLFNRVKKIWTTGEYVPNFDEISGNEYLRLYDPNDASSLTKLLKSEGTKADPISHISTLINNMAHIKNKMPMFQTLSDFADFLAVVDAKAWENTNMLRSIEGDEGSVDIFKKDAREKWKGKTVIEEMAELDKKGEGKLKNTEQVITFLKNLVDINTGGRTNLEKKFMTSRPAQTLKLLNNNVKTNLIIGNIGSIYSQVQAMLNLAGNVDNALDLAHYLTTQKDVLAKLFTDVKNGLTLENFEVFEDDWYFQQSAYLQDRVSNAVSKKYESALEGNLAQTVSEAMAYALEYGDGITARAMFKYNYQKGLRDGMTQEEAIDNADRLLYTQIGSRSAGFKTIAQTDNFINSLIPFTTESGNSVRVANDIYRKIIKSFGDEDEFKKALASIISLWFGSYLLNKQFEFFRMGKRSTDMFGAVEDAITSKEDNKIKKAINTVLYPVSEYIGSFPAGDTAFTLLTNISKFEGSDIFGDYQPNKYGTAVGVLPQTLSDLAVSMYHMAKIQGEDIPEEELKENMDKYFEKFSKSILKLTVPYGGVNQAFKTKGATDLIYDDREIKGEYGVEKDTGEEFLKVPLGELSALDKLGMIMFGRNANKDFDKYYNELLSNEKSEFSSGQTKKLNILKERYVDTGQYTIEELVDMLNVMRQNVKGEDGNNETKREKDKRLDETYPNIPFELRNDIQDFLHKDKIY